MPNQGPRDYGKSAHGDRNVKADTTRQRALDLLNKHRLSAPDKRHAEAYLDHLIYGKPLGLTKVSSNLAEVVKSEVAKACSETGYKLPTPKKRTPRKKR